MRRKVIAVYTALVLIALVYIGHMTPYNPDYSVSKHYVNAAYAETGAVNVVTSIYLNYRYYDTLFEALMLLFSIIGVVYLSVHDGGDKIDE